MKKFILLLLICLFIVNIYADDITDQPVSIMFEGTTSDYYIPKVDSYGVVTADTGVDMGRTEVDRMDVSLDHAYTFYRDYKKPIFIGHSQGGLWPWQQDSTGIRQIRKPQVI